ncbi:MarR family transcriptional regulator [Actinotalea sp. M2MS4P-6]|uniref:MarR family winged helix-turn-helix transcriptional regulator n=1 Tax=Actinotalea sp. M2MS4P-6 TaxID=2983762 RepID=UPI0021E362D1|nr:MarR family transcriptional regulator [Actinotalea sp. M2MS4P-6]MCV2395114.1 MarR family transcriptional regulator [Actinotalea sp. M2MS4P-6]
MDRTAEDEKARIIQCVIAIADHAQAIVDATLQEFDAPASAPAVLRILTTSRTPVTPRDLARLLDRDPSTASLIADKLEQTGLITRQPHPDDGRKRILTLTERGHQLWDRMRAGLHDSAVFDGISAAERGRLLELLERVRPRDLTV